jgi:hypothetical protein
MRVRELKWITDMFVPRIRRDRRQTRRDTLRRAVGVALTVPVAVVGRYAAAQPPPLPKLPAVPAGDAVLLTPSDLQFAKLKRDRAMSAVASEEPPVVFGATDVAGTPLTNVPVRYRVYGRWFCRTTEYSARGRAAPYVNVARCKKAMTGWFLLNWWNHS